MRFPAFVLPGAALGLALASSIAFAQPMATAEAEQPGVRIEITELKRTSGTVTIRMALVNAAERISALTACSAAPISARFT